jgi:hypothetical protein
MKRVISCIIAIGMTIFGGCQSENYKTISVDELRNKIAGVLVQRELDKSTFCF